MSVWHEVGAAQRGGVSLQLSRYASCNEMSDKTSEAQVVIFESHVTARGHEGEVGRLVQGLLHIGAPHKKDCYGAYKNKG